jgi:hypothetical protein
VCTEMYGPPPVCKWIRIDPEGVGQLVHRACFSLLLQCRWRPDCVAGHEGLEVRRETGKE